MWKKVAFSGVRSEMPISILACSDLPIFISVSTIGLAICAGMAKPMPEKLPEGEIRKVSSHDFTAGVYQRSTGVAGIDGRVCLYKLAGLAGVIRVWVGAINRAHDSTGHSEAETEWVTECQHRLSRLQRSRITPGNAGQIGSD